MARKKLGIGVQNFDFFKNEDIIYVDKTEKIWELMQLGMHNFIVRPRRFGKSLFLDTIAAIYAGRREQFADTWAYNNIDWETVQRPTLRIDFTAIDYKACSLEDGLKSYFSRLATTLGINQEGQSSKNIFIDLISKLSEHKPIAILIDEYEMAVTDFVGEDEEKLQANIVTLRDLYSTMKGMGAHIHRSYFTGVSKIGKIGVLSGLNMLNDLTLDERFTTLFGYTESELRHYYAEYITEAARRYDCTEEEILAQIKAHYNGYSWDAIEDNKVYNPYSIVNFFQSFKFRNFWFETGTPTVLARGAQKQYLDLEALDNIEVNSDVLSSANLREFYSTALLFQAGYLTIKKVERLEWEDLYTLGFPNREVHAAFAKYLLSEYMEQPVDFTDITLAHKLRLHLERQQLKEAFHIFAKVISSTAYDITKHTEGYFHTIMHVLMYSTGLATFSELENADGRLDTICVAHKSIYIFEFKINSTAKGAIKQIKQQNYALPFLNDSKALYIIGVNFLTEEKRINEVLVEQWNGVTFENIEDNFVPVLVA